jgi:hypothetical protein
MRRKYTWLPHLKVWISIRKCFIIECGCSRLPDLLQKKTAVLTWKRHWLVSSQFVFRNLDGWYNPCCTLNECPLETQRRCFHQNIYTWSNRRIFLNAKRTQKDTSVAYFKMVGLRNVCVWVKIGSLCFWNNEAGMLTLHLCCGSFTVDLLPSCLKQRQL